MTALTFEERNLVCIYSGGSLQKTIAALDAVRPMLTDPELQELAGSALDKLRRMSGAQYDALDWTPDFAPEEAAYGE